MMDNVPAGLKHKEDYQTVVSSDSQGLGAVAALILDKYLPEGAEVGHYHLRHLFLRDQ